MGRSPDSPSDFSVWLLTQPAQLQQWVAASVPFRAFVVSNRSKINKKLKTEDAERRLGALAELAVARLMYYDPPSGLTEWLQCETYALAFVCEPIVRTVAADGLEGEREQVLLSGFEGSLRLVVFRMPSDYPGDRTAYLGGPTSIPYTQREF